MPAGALEGELGIRPQMHLFVGSKAPAHRSTTALPQHEAYPPEWGAQGLDTPARATSARRDLGQLRLRPACVSSSTDRPFRMHHCHCGRCRHARGGAHATNVIYKLDALRYTQGESLLEDFDLPGAEFFGTSFCRHCGGAMPRRSAGRGVVVVPVGALDVGSADPSAGASVRGVEGPVVSKSTTACRSSPRRAPRTCSLTCGIFPVRWQPIAPLAASKGPMGVETNLGQRRALNLAPWALLLLALQAHAVQIDGRIDADEWLEARHITDFRKVQPLNGEPATLATEAWILATPEGLAVAFRNTQPPSVPRTLQRVQRDFEEQVDRVNVIVDFDGDHRTGYDFTISYTDGISDSIVTNENNFNSDWDGNWQHAVGVGRGGLDGRGADSLAHRADAPGRTASARWASTSIGSSARPANGSRGRWRASSVRVSCPTSRPSRCPTTASRCWPSRRMCPDSTTRSARAATATPVSTCSGSRMARRSSRPR